MRTRTRHLWGLLLGVIGAPILLAAVAGGVVLAGRGGDVFATRASFAALGVAALVTVILAAPRVSPVASLISGLALAGLATLVVVPGGSPGPWMRRVLPPADITFGHGTALPFDQAAVAVLSTGAYALVGAILVLASLAPSRWRGRSVTFTDPAVEAEDASWRAALPGSGPADRVDEPPSNVSTAVSPASDGV